MPLSLKWITSENVSDSLNSRYVYSSIWLITLGSYSLIPISFRMAAMTKASFGVLFAGKEPSACSLVSVLSAMMFSIILLHDSYTTIKTIYEGYRCSTPIETKMAAAFPSERSTKDVINSILDDYEKLTKYVACYTIFLNQLFCVISNAMSSVL